MTRAEPLSPVLRRIITQLTALRMANGWTQTQTADKAGLHSDYVSEIERNVRTPSAETVSRLAALYGLHLTVEPRPAALLETTDDMGTEIRRIRLSKGLRLQDIADASGIAPTNLSSYENGRCRPDPETLLRIVAALGCRLAIVGWSR